VKALAKLVLQVGEHHANYFFLQSLRRNSLRLASPTSHRHGGILLIKNDTLNLLNSPHYFFILNKLLFAHV